MTLYQVFIWFCKENKILGDLYSLHLNHPAEFQTCSYGQIVYKRQTFKERIESILSNELIPFHETLHDFIVNLDSTYATKFTISENGQCILRKWNYFVKNNIILDDEQFSDGKKITLSSRITAHNDDIKFYIHKNEAYKSDKRHVFVKMYFSDGENRIVQIGKRSIIKVEGENVEYKVKRKRKIYE